MIYNFRNFLMMMLRTLYLYPVVLWLLLIASASCHKISSYTDCPNVANILDTIDLGTDQYILSRDGVIYSRTNDQCLFVSKYFDPTFSSNYVVENKTVFLRENDLTIPTINEYREDFERTSTFNDLFIKSKATFSNTWTGFTALSPKHPTVTDYVALRNCILKETCQFDENSMEVLHQVVSNTSHCMRFYAAAPSAAMVTSKASLETILLYADLHDEVTIAADVYIEEGMPYSLFDLENKWFDESPGIRLVFDQNYLGTELKYGTKPRVKQPISTRQEFPMKQWVGLKIYYVLKNDGTGKIKIWQDNKLVIDADGKTLPTSNSIQTNLEVGITATGKKSIVYMDNIYFQVIKH